MTPQQRGRLGACVRESRGTTNTEPARAAFQRKFELEVDPDGILDPDEREKRASAARSAYYTRLAHRRWG
jgi:hypothetical protein